MDSTNNDVSQIILQSSESIMPSTSYSSSSSDTSFFDSLKNINATTWILIILILAFFGFNIFIYLAKGTQSVADFFAPLTKAIFGTTAMVTGQAVDISAEGAKTVVGETAGVINAGLTAVQDVIPNAAPSGIKSQQYVQQPPDVMQQSSLNKALNTSQRQQSSQQDYQANEASSSVHSVGKAGWCYIGDDRGFRTCGEVGVSDTCMSGDIFPSQEICMNPSLRA
jgi:preprotein translocase subunit SecG